MFKVYLAGYISGEVIQKCISWRSKIAGHYSNAKWREKIIFLDPLNGKDLSSITRNGLQSSCPTNAIVHRDYSSVISADLIIANLDMFGEKRVPVGTISEIAWAWEHHKPIILITNEEQFKEHPFLKYFVSWVVKDVDELLHKKCINYIFKGLHSAIY